MPVLSIAACAWPQATICRARAKGGRFQMIRRSPKWSRPILSTPLKRLYNAFTHKEIKQLSDPKSPLSRSMPALPQQPQGFRDGLMDLFRRDNTFSWPWAQRHDELSKNITRGVDRDRGYEMD